MSKMSIYFVAIVVVIAAALGFAGLNHWPQRSVSPTVSMTPTNKPRQSTTPVVSPTSSPTVSPKSTPVKTPTPTPTPSFTTTPSPTATPTPTPTLSPTPTPSFTTTPSPTATPTPTATPVPVPQISSVYPALPLTVKSGDTFRIIGTNFMVNNVSQIYSINIGSISWTTPMNVQDSQTIITTMQSSYIGTWDVFVTSGANGTIRSNVLHNAVTISP